LTNWFGESTFLKLIGGIDLKVKTLTTLIMAVAFVVLIMISCGQTEKGGVSGAMEQGGSQILKKEKVGSLVSIPENAEIILATPWAKTRSEFGFPSNELFVADSEGKNVTQITHNKYHYNHFAVSPNRRMIAAIRYSSGDSNGDGRIDFRDRKTLWILDLENREEWPLVPEYDAGWGGVDWSPNNQFVYFSILRDLKSDIYRIRPDGTGFNNITEGIEKILSPELSNKWVSDTGVSHDGEWIVFLYSGRSAGSGFRTPAKSRIALCRVDGTEPRLITDGGDVEPMAHGPWGPGDFDPEFSPDGRHICFQRATDVAINFATRIPSHDIMRVNIDGTGLKRLSPERNPGIHGISDWSEDNRIIFSEWNGTDRYVGPVVVNTDGSNYHRLTNLPSGGSHVRWIPPVKK
jgi:Tol biopolymer transport system component